jgi:hypothetical protein
LQSRVGSLSCTDQIVYQIGTDPPLTEIVNNPNKPDCGKCASWKAVGKNHQKLRGDIYSLCINAIILNHIKLKRQTDKQMSGESNISKKQTQTD